MLERDGQVLGLEGGHIHLAEQALVDEAADFDPVRVRNAASISGTVPGITCESVTGTEGAAATTGRGAVEAGAPTVVGEGAVIGGADIEAPVTVGAMRAEVFE